MIKIKFIYFLILVFRSLAAIIGSSAIRNLEMNSVAAPRKPGEAVGAICHLTKND